MRFWLKTRVSSLLDEKKLLKIQQRFGVAFIQERL